MSLLRSSPHCFESAVLSPVVYCSSLSHILDVCCHMLYARYRNCSPQSIKSVLERANPDRGMSHFSPSLRLTRKHAADPGLAHVDTNKRSNPCPFLTYKRLTSATVHSQLWLEPHIHISSRILLGVLPPVHSFSITCIFFKLLPHPRLVLHHNKSPKTTTSRSATSRIATRSLTRAYSNIEEVCCLTTSCQAKH